MPFPMRTAANTRNSTAMTAELLAARKIFHPFSVSAARFCIAKYTTSGSATPIVPMATKTIKAPACCAAGMPDWAIVAAAAIMRARFFGFTPDSSDGLDGGLVPGSKQVERAHAQGRVHCLLQIFRGHTHHFLHDPHEPPVVGDAEQGPRLLANLGERPVHVANRIKK